LAEVLRCADLGVFFCFTVALVGAFFVDFEAPEAVFGFAVPVASFFAVVFAGEVFFFDAAGAAFFWGALFAAAGFVAATDLLIFLSPVVTAAGAFFAFGLATGAFLVAADALTLGLAVVVAFFVGVEAALALEAGFALLAEAVLVLGEDGFTGLFSFAESPFGASLTLPDRPFGSVNVPLSAPVLILRLSWLVMAALKSIP